MPVRRRVSPGRCRPAMPGAGPAFPARQASRPLSRGALPPEGATPRFGITATSTVAPCSGSIFGANELVPDGLPLCRRGLRTFSSVASG